jgi:hypothetical protein
MMSFKDVPVRFTLALSLAMAATTGIAAEIPPGTQGAGVAVVSFPALAVPVQALTVKAAEGKSYDLKVIPGMHDALAGAWLPEGDYTLKAWDGRRVLDGPSFHVQAGKATDLGALVQVDVGNYLGSVAHLHNPVSDAAARTALAALKAPDGVEAMPWAPGDAPLKLEAAGYTTSPLGGIVVGIMTDINKNRNARPLSERLGSAPSSTTLLEAAMSSALPVMLRPARDTSGNLYFGAELGQVRMRHAGGEWTTLDTGSLHPVTAFAVAGDALVAGLDNGELRVSRDQGAHWEEAKRLECGGGRVTDVEFSGTHWAATAINGFEMVDERYPRFFWHTRVCAYASDDADITHLLERKSVNVDRFKSVGAGSQLTRDAYFTVIAPDLMKLDLATMTWSKVAVPDQVTNFSLNEATHTVATSRAQGMFSSMYLSTDDGASWKKIDRPPYAVMALTFASPTEGYALRAKSRTFSVQWIAYGYNAALDKWTETKVLPDECMAGMSDGDGKTAFCLTRGGSIFNLAKAPMALEYLRD